MEKCQYLCEINEISTLIRKEFSGYIVFEKNIHNPNEHIILSIFKFSQQTCKALDKATLSLVI